MGRWHARTIGKVGGRVLAVADLDLAAAQDLASRYPGASSFASVEQMLEQARLDVVHICTPTESHVSLAEAALGAGRNVLIEKPLAPTAPETARLLELATSCQTQICPIHQFVFQDGVSKAKAWLPRIGRIVYTQATFHSAGGDQRAKEQKDQIAADILPHPLSLIQEFLPGCLASAPWRTFRPAPGEWRAFSQAFDIGLSIQISMNARPTVCAFRVAGTQGTIHLDLFHGYAYLEPGRVSRSQKVLQPLELAARQSWAATLNLSKRAIRWEPAYPGLRHLIRLFYGAVASRTAPPISKEDILAVATARDSVLAGSRSHD
jgi:predicted dehydrogenase